VAARILIVWLPSQVTHILKPESFGHDVRFVIDLFMRIRRFDKSAYRNLFQRVSVSGWAVNEVPTRDAESRATVVCI
jgi:hypothetical protein